MFRRLLKYITGDKGMLAAAALFALLGSGLGLAAPVIFGSAIDAISAFQMAELLRLLLLLSLVYIFSALLQWAVPLLSARVAGHTVERLRHEIFSKLNKLPVKFFDTHKHGDIMSTLTNDMDSISDGISQSLDQILTGAVTVLGTLVIMFFINVYIALAVLIITPVSIFIAKYITTHSSKMFREQQRLVGSLGAFGEETVSGMKTVKAFGSEAENGKHFTGINGELCKAAQKAQFYSSLVNPTTRVINNLSYIAVGVLGSLLVLNGGGKMTVGTIATMLTYATQFAKPINEITAVTTQLQNALAGCRRVFALLDEQEEAPDPLPACELAGVKGEVRFDRVRFGYTPERTLIENMNLETAPGKVVAIVGPTGSGKTTVVNLLMRFYDPQEGTIAIDGIPIAKVTRESLRRSITMVLQDTWLFQGTIHENIAYGRPDAAREEVEQAAKEAYAHSFIMKLPQGYDTVISGDGSGLSQGQQQLLTIARAMLADAPILVLDEATSSVDLRTEQKIQKAFNAIMQGHTCFVIAHRLSTIKNADAIIVIKDGRIQEQGTHRELLARNGLYASIYNSQFAGRKHIM
jgi:ABC-type multidrug transport system fused ATPase/permease subunit